jgi:hypothetical protein
MRAHLATCSPLRSSAYRKYASSLRGCARVDLRPPPATRPLPTRDAEANVASLVRKRILTPSPSPAAFLVSLLPSADRGGCKLCERSDVRMSAREKGGEVGLRILFVTLSEARRHTLFPAGWGQSREEGPSRRARRAAGRRRTPCTPHDRRTEHASRRTLIARLRTARGLCGHDPTSTEQRPRAAAR